MKSGFACTILMIFCAQSGWAETVNEPEISEPLIHVIISDEIRDIMLKINQLVNERELTQLQILEQREKYLNDLIQATDRLMATALTIRDAIPGVSMSPENHRIFEALARQLNNDAKNLKDTAETDSYSGLEPAYGRLRETCAACHRLYRF